MSESTCALPPGWAACALEEVRGSDPGSFVDGPFGSNLKTEHYTAVGPRVIRLENVGDGVFRDAETHISPEHFDRLSRHEARARDVVIALLGDTVPRACLVPARVGPAIVKADCPRLRPDPRVVLPEFVAFALNSEQVRRQARALVHGVGRPRLKLSELRALTIPIAPLAEQRRIVEALETHFTRLDAAVATLERVRANLKRYRAALLQAAVEGRLDGQGQPPSSEDGPWPIPTGWAWATVGDAGDVLLGRQRAPQYLTGAFDRPYLRVANVKDDHLALDDVNVMDFDAAHYAKYRLEPGDILVCEGQSPELVGQSAIYRGEIDGLCFQKTLHRFRARRDRCSPEFSQIVFRAHVRSGMFQRYASITTNIAHLVLRKFRVVPFPLPPREEQDRIVERFARSDSILCAADATIVRQQARAARLRKSLLRLAFSGRLVPQDPHDEPASVLLDRIRAARAATPEAKRTRRGRAPRAMSPVPQEDA